MLEEDRDVSHVDAVPILQEVDVHLAAVDLGARLGFEVDQLVASVGLGFDDAVLGFNGGVVDDDGVVLGASDADDAGFELEDLLLAVGAGDDEARHALPPPGRRGATRSGGGRGGA